MNEQQCLAPFISNIKLRYPKKLDKIDLRCLAVLGARELEKQKLPPEIPVSVLLNNALIFCATDSILRHSKDITWGILLELKTQKPYLGIDIE